MMRTVSMRELPARLANRIAVRVAIVPVRLVVDLVRRVTDALLPVLRPIQVLIAHLRRCFRVATHHHTVNHTADQRAEAEYQEYDTENPVVVNIAQIRNKTIERSSRTPHSPHKQRLHKLDDNDKT